MDNNNIFSRLARFIPDPSQILAPFRIHTGDDEIKQFYMQMRQYSRRPKLYVKQHKELNNIECLISTDLSAAFDMHMASSQPERKAYLFLQNIAGLNVLGLDATFLKESLFVKKTKTSDLGTHCVFGLRHEGKVLGESCFVVHLDTEQRVVMLYCIYQQFTDMLKGGLESIDSPSEIRPEAEMDLETQPPIYIDELAEKSEILKSANETGAVLMPNWSSGAYQSLEKIEIVTEEGNFIWLIDEQGNIRHRYAIDAAFAYSYVGSVRDDFVKQIKKPTHKPNVWHQETKKVILRGLYSTVGHLEGEYVKVEDQITKRWGKKDVFLKADPRADSSAFDRLQAYYHIDRIQRYFRALGLTVLDDFSETKQVRVVLTKSAKRRTSYAPSEKTLYFKQVPFPSQAETNSLPMDWTDARDAKIIYHEYVHAVTDALATLRHQDLRDVENPRYRDMLQAAAMDEGMADYFACSLATGDGTKQTTTGTLYQWVNRSRGIELGWEAKHELEPQPQLQLVHQPSQHQLADQAEEIIYQWGEQWSRFLWGLREEEQIGREVADTLIAHSILYLTRWSSFHMGILAILLVDKLLFNGVHHEHILKTSTLNIRKISEKPAGSLSSEFTEQDPWIEVDFTISGTGNAKPEEVQAEDEDLQFGVDPYLIDEWVFEGGKLVKTRHRIRIEE